MLDTASFSYSTYFNLLSICCRSTRCAAQCTDCVSLLMVLSQGFAILVINFNNLWVFLNHMSLYALLTTVDRQTTYHLDLSVFARYPRVQIRSQEPHDVLADAIRQPHCSQYARPTGLERSSPGHERRWGRTTTSRVAPHRH